MVKAAPDATLDATLDYIAGATELTVCSQQPTTFTEATSTYALGDYVMAGGDYTKSDLAAGGRRLTVAAQTGNTGDATGTGTHVALVDGSAIRLVTTCDPVDIVSGTAFDTASFRVDFPDPT